MRVKPHNLGLALINNFKNFNFDRPLDFSKVVQICKEAPRIWITIESESLQNLSQNLVHNWIFEGLVFPGSEN